LPHSSATSAPELEPDIIFYLNTTVSIIGFAALSLYLTTCFLYSNVNLLSLCISIQATYINNLGLVFCTNVAKAARMLRSNEIYGYMRLFLNVHAGVEHGNVNR
jgi:hypothetical protein